MFLKAQNIRLQYTEDKKTEIVLTSSDNMLQIQKEATEIKGILSKGKELSVEVKQYRHKRSLDANSYCWVVCQKIAEAIRATKEEVYRKAIREVGQFEIVPIKAEAVERWIECWNSKGIGWFSEIMEDSKLTGYKKVISYYGSSVYNSLEMSALIDYIVQDAKELGIEVMTPDELSLIKQEWETQKAS